jgi:hypothetical protein
MNRTKQIIALIMGTVGVLLIAKGVWGGVWPPSLQLIAGILLVTFAGLRLWILR